MKQNRLVYYYKDFLSSPQQYEECEAYWYKLSKSILKDFENYTEWFKNVFGNGKSCGDGNPIFTLKHKTKGKAIRIIQEEPKSKRAFIYGWIEKIDDEGLEVLVIALELSNQTEKEIRKIISEWFMGHSRIKFEGQLQQMNADYGKRVLLQQDKKTEALLELLEIAHEINEINKNYISKTALLKGSANINSFGRIYARKNKIANWGTLSATISHVNIAASNKHKAPQDFISHSEDYLAVMVYAFIMFVSLDNSTSLAGINPQSYFNKVSEIYGSRTRFTQRYYGFVERISELSERVEEEIYKK